MNKKLLESVNTLVEGELDEGVFDKFKDKVTNAAQKFKDQSQLAAERARNAKTDAELVQKFADQHTEYLNNPNKHPKDIQARKDSKERSQLKTPEGAYVLNRFITDFIQKNRKELLYTALRDQEIKTDVQKANEDQDEEKLVCSIDYRNAESADMMVKKINELIKPAFKKFLQQYKEVDQGSTQLKVVKLNQPDNRVAIVCNILRKSIKDPKLLNRDLPDWEEHAIQHTRDGKFILVKLVGIDGGYEIRDSKTGEVKDTIKAKTDSQAIKKFDEWEEVLYKIPLMRSSPKGRYSLIRVEVTEPTGKFYKFIVSKNDVCVKTIDTTDLESAKVIFASWLGSYRSVAKTPDKKYQLVMNPESDCDYSIVKMASSDKIEKVEQKLVSHNDDGAKREFVTWLSKIKEQEEKSQEKVNQ